MNKKEKFGDKDNLNYFKHENHRQPMGRNHTGHIYSNHCYNYDLMCTIMHNEYEYSEKQQQCNATDGTNSNVKR